MRSNKARAGALAGGIALCGTLFVFAARFDWILDILDVFDLVQGISEISEIGQTSTAVFATLRPIQQSAEAVLSGTRLVIVPTQSPTPILTPSPGPCSPSRINQPLPELTARLHAGVESAGLSEIEANASAFGEGCVEAVTSAVRGFMAMRSSLNFTAPVDDLDDNETLGDLLAQLLTTLNSLPPDSYPGVDSPTINVEFTTENAHRTMRFTLDDAKVALERGLTGAALIVELGD